MVISRNAAVSQLKMARQRLLTSRAVRVKKKLQMHGSNISGNLWVVIKNNFIIFSTTSSLEVFTWNYRTKNGQRRHFLLHEYKKSPHTLFEYFLMQICFKVLVNSEYHRHLWQLKNSVNFFHNESFNFTACFNVRNENNVKIVFSQKICVFNLSKIM